MGEFKPDQQDFNENENIDEDRLKEISWEVDRKNIPDDELLDYRFLMLSGF